MAQETIARYRANMKPEFFKESWCPHFGGKISWLDLVLGHDFHEVVTLPEDDRVRYTISSTARREVLKRLLAENHARAAEEAARASTKQRYARQKTAKAKHEPDAPNLFPMEADHGQA